MSTATIRPANRLARAIAAFERLPAPLRSRLTTMLFNSQVRFAGTGGLRFERLSAEQAIVVIDNRRKVQNHVKGVHAAAMALLVETATGAVFGMNVRDDALPLLKTLHVDYLQRAQGAMIAVAALGEAERARIAAEPKGEIRVPVTVTDESGEQPVRAQLTWAWVPKKQ